MYDAPYGSTLTFCQFCPPLPAKLLAGAQFLSIMYSKYILACAKLSHSFQKVLTAHSKYPVAGG